jgi:hypothetical protein
MQPRTADRVTRPQATEADALVRLADGARMDQETFHALYPLTPEKFRAELIGGVVHTHGRVTVTHGSLHARLLSWPGNFAASALGVEAFCGTLILGRKSEPHPDALLMLPPEPGGGTRIDSGDFLCGPPGLVAEVGYPTADIELDEKFADYERAGVREYLVIDVPNGAVHWFVRRRGAFAELAPGDDGVFRSETFPGLCLSAATFFGRSPRPLLALLGVGLATPEHAAFVAKLAARRKAPKRKKK